MVTRGNVILTHALAGYKWFPSQLAWEGKIGRNHFGADQDSQLLREVNGGTGVPP